MFTTIRINQEDPDTIAARQLMDALWIEIQLRYGFTAPNPMRASAFTGEKACFWIAWSGKEAIGSIAIVPISDSEAELDAMYVEPAFRGSGAAQALLDALEQYAIANKFFCIKLRAGSPQPEALRFYEKAGFLEVAPFGKWQNDPTARCYIKNLNS